MAKKAGLPIKKAEGSTKMKPVPVKIVSDMPTNVARDDDRERKWRAEDALRTCKEYHKISGDKELMRDVKKLANEEMKKLANVAKK